MFQTLIRTIERLRAKGGCPWDQKQTIADYKKYLLEEAYELCDAINKGDEKEVAEELGDVLLNLLLIATILKEHGISDINSIVKELTEKVVSRHPHVFGTAVAKDEKAAFLEWHKAKKNKENKDLFDSIPRSAPALARASLISRRASKAGFGFENIDQLILKLHEETNEMENELRNQNKMMLKQEMGDMFYALINMCVFLDIDPEECINYTNEKFLARIAKIKQKLSQEGKDFFSADRTYIEQLWEETKKK